MIDRKHTFDGTDHQSATKWRNIITVGEAHGCCKSCPTSALKGRHITATGCLVQVPDDVMIINLMNACLNPRRRCDILVARKGSVTIRAVGAKLFPGK